jgi:hypothetical protein
VEASWATAASGYTPVPAGYGAPHPAAAPAPPAAEPTPAPRPPAGQLHPPVARPAAGVPSGFGNKDGWQRRSWAEPGAGTVASTSPGAHAASPQPPYSPSLAQGQAGGGASHGAYRPATAAAAAPVAPPGPPSPGPGDGGLFLDGAPFATEMSAQEVGRYAQLCGSLKTGGKVDG